MPNASAAARERVWDLIEPQKKEALPVDKHSEGESAPERKRHTTWAEFIRHHKEVLWATDFFTDEVWD